MGRGCPCPALDKPHTGRTYEILRLCALLKPAKEALRPTTPTAAASREDRNRTLTDMAVTYRERAGASASHHHLVRLTQGWPPSTMASKVLPSQRVLSQLTDENTESQ